MIKATFRIIYFTKAKKYVAFAWNYDEGVLLTSAGSRTDYHLARLSLEDTCRTYNVELAYFDGEYTCEGEGAQLMPAGDLFSSMRDRSFQERNKSA